MIVVCLCGIVAIRVLPRSAWAMIVPSALLAQPESGPGPGPGPALASGALSASPLITPTATARAVALISTPSRPMPVASPTAVPTASQTPAVPGQTMYVCGYERCRDSDAYGELIFETGIEVWASSDPDDNRVLSAVSHDAEVWVVSAERIWEGPGGLWLELAGGGWMNDLWLTEERCTPDNLEQYSLTDCMLGEY
jgi:hypothetical protein